MKKTIFTIIISLIFLGFAFFMNPFSRADNTLNGRVRGKILLQVEQNGEAWYVHPDSEVRYYLGRPFDAFMLMKKFGTGITNENINKIPIASENLTGEDSDNDGLPDALENAINTNASLADSDHDGFSDYTEIMAGFNPLGKGKLPYNEKFSQKQAGKILIQTEQNGEAWYVEPERAKRYFLGRPQDAFNVMRQLGMGISNNDIAKIPTSIDSEINNEAIVKNNTAIVAGNNYVRSYRDPVYSYSMEYPKEWQIKKTKDKDSIVFLGDYQNDPFSENKGLIMLIYIKTPEDSQLDAFKIASKPQANKDKSEETELNGYVALAEEFSYSRLNSYEITTTIEKSPREFLQAILVNGSNSNYYKNIYQNLLDSIKFYD